jgi:hypothetical protein
MSQVLILHGYVWDPAFNKSPIEGAVIGELDRLCSDLDFGPFNALRKDIQAGGGGSNNVLITGAQKLGYDETICGHSHLHADLTMQNGKKFLNCGCWYKDVDHGYVKWPNSDEVYISDTHIGADESDIPAIMKFLTFARGQTFKLKGLGDIFDLYARSAEYILTQYKDVIDMLKSYPNFEMLCGNHDHNADDVRKIMGWLPDREIKTFETFTMDDRASWASFPA